MATDLRTATARPDDRYDQFVVERLSKVRTGIRLRDVFGGVLTLITGLLTLLLLLIVADHWLFDLGFAGRFLGFVAMLSWTVVITVTRILPTLIHRINPLYAAKVIEDSDPTLKSSLLNLVFFRSHRQQMKEVVYRAVESDAVQRLSRVEVDTAVDQSSLVRLAVALAVLVVTMGLYTAVSPKSPFQSIARLAAPWRTLARPARVRITDVEPGATQVFFGQSLQVSARVDRIASGEPVFLVVSSSDGQYVDLRHSMLLDDQTRRFTWLLTGVDGSGIRQDLFYRIEAGDAGAGPYPVQVVPAPTLVIDRVEYKFPAYTEQPDETVEHEGDVSAIEGTRVTIHASSNQPISSAYIEFDPESETASGSVRDTISMDHEQLSARASFTLLLTPDRSAPVRKSFQLRLVNQDREQNQTPILYDIGVIPDYAPEVEILEPAQRETRIPENGSMPIRIRALDPDFRLGELAFHVASSGRHLASKSLLDEPTEGTVVQQLFFTPRKLNLKSGDVAVIWATAADNRAHPVTGEPEPNTVKTDRYVIRVDEAKAQPPQDDRREPQRGDSPAAAESPPDSAPQASNPTDRASDPGTEPPPGDRPSEAHERSTATEPTSDQHDPPPQSQDAPADGSDAESSSQQSSNSNSPSSSNASDAMQQSPTSASGSERSTESAAQQPSEPIANDGSQDGDAFERILRRMEQQNQDGGTGAQENQQPAAPNGASQSQPEETGKSQQPDQQPDGQAPSTPQQPSTGQQRSGEQSEQQPQGQQQPGQQSGQQQQSGEQQSGKQQQGQPQSGQQQSDRQQGQQQPGQQQPGQQQQSGEQQPGQQQQGQQQSGQQQSDQQQAQQQPGQQQPGQQQPGQQQPGQQPQSGEQQSGQQQSGQQQQSGEQQSGEQQSGEQQSGEQQSGEQQSGEQQSGEQQSGQQQSGQQQSGQKQSGQQPQSGEQQSGQQQSGQQQGQQQQPGQQQQSGQQQSGQQRSR